jgi:membrane-associated phospholipid phosphatase
VYCCLALRRYRGAVLVAASVLIASGLSELVLKPIVDRTRYGSLSYPSGHATAAFALATAIVVLLARPPKTNMPRSMRIVLAVLAMGTAATIAAGLVEIHYFTDTIGGAGVGIAVTLSAALLMDRFSFLGERAPQAAAAVPAAAESARVP